MEQLKDPVLCQLMMMGIHDWNGVDARLHQATQAIRYTGGKGKITQQVHWEFIEGSETNRLPFTQ